MKTSKENMEDHADSLLLLTRDDWDLNNRCEMLYHIKQLQSHIKDIGELVPCDCGRQFGAFAAGTAESPNPKTTACPACKGTGFDFNHRWDEGWSAACETCAGYGEVGAEL